MVPFPLHPARSPMGFFSDVYYGNMVKLLEINLTVLFFLPHDEFLTHRLVHTEPPGICQLVHVLLVHRSRGGFPLWVSALQVHDPCIHPLVSLISDFPASSHILGTQEIIVGFSVCLAFYLVGWSFIMALRWGSIISHLPSRLTHLPHCLENQKWQQLTYKLVKNQKVLWESGDFCVRVSLIGRGRNIGAGSSQWTKVEPMLEIKLSFLLESRGIDEEYL